MIPPKPSKSQDKLYVYEVEADLSFDTPTFLGRWPDGGLFYLFFTAPEDRRVNLAARERGARVLSCHAMDRDLWRPRVALPLRVGRFVITEAGRTEPAVPSGVVIGLEPGLVFGGGDHPTTRACLLALDGLLNETVPEVVLDVGTGTGILALAAALAGSRRVRAVDINPLAVETAKNNVRLNRAGHAVHVILGDGLGELGRGDLVFLNLGASLIRRAAPGLGGYGFIVVSGFLKGEETGVLKDLEGYGALLSARYEDQGWPALLLRTKAREGAVV